MSSDENTALLREILKWIRFSGMKEVRNVLSTTLDTPQKRRIYQLSNGDNSSRDIAKATHVNDKTVRNYWRVWAKAGIAEPIKVGTGDRYRRTFDLEELGIDVGEIGEMGAQTGDVN